VNGNGTDSLSFEPPEQEIFVFARRMFASSGGFWRFTAFRFRKLRQKTRLPPTKPVETAPPVDKEERARQRITLVRMLFRGREDVYARRWENNDGRHGYVPAAAKDWKSINKSRPEERKKVDQTRRFFPLTDAVIENHLLDKETFGGLSSAARRNVLASRGRFR
jgi:hypothetical protein